MRFFVSLVVGAIFEVGCAGPRTEARRLPAWVFESSRTERSATAPPRHPRPQGGIRGRSEASDFVVAALQGAGLRFGTDGSVESLWGYLRTSHRVVASTATRPGDILFFRTREPTHETCAAPDHVGIVATVDRDGRIGFAEARDGEVRRSYVDPERPLLRRDAEGRVLNTFLRPLKIGDPADSPIFAGEMLCAAVRPRT